ncbi:MAG: glycerophosphodiester phosphodiesterase family protein [Chloroflexi bacterium]|nr:glycerophosphodiester phosphodiesterase family protein [Chloroflexota bacterium]
MLDMHLQGLDRAVASPTDHELALRYAALIRFDAKEPFLPSAVGYTIFRETGSSSSFPREIQLNENIAFAIEYAIWWDWDIGHLYELEHIWAYVDCDGVLVDTEASWHGGYNRMADGGGRPCLVDNRPALYSEPGKHAFAPSPDWLLDRRAKTVASCGRHAGRMGVHVTPLFAGIIRERGPLNNRLVHTYLERLRFEPSFDFSKEFDLREAVFVPWQQLREWIPPRVCAWVEHLRHTIPPNQRRVLRIAHRGASAYSRENSTEALRAAAELGADMVEIDIRATADEAPVVIHDSGLRRVYGIDGSVSDFSMNELRRMDTARGKIISFEEAAGLCRRLGLGLYLDLKELKPRSLPSLLETLDEYHYLQDTIFGSFRPDFLAHIKAERVDAQTSILFNAVNVDPVKLAQSIEADYVHPCWESRAAQPHRLLTPEWIAAVREADLGIVCWHEERPEEVAALKALGVDAICSDKPEILV